MRCIGFSTRALARGNFRLALDMLVGKNVNAIELSALRQEELGPLVAELDRLDLARFRHVSFHAPSSIEPSREQGVLKLLAEVVARGWPIIVHPDAILNPSEWSWLGDSLCIENMDKRKAVGQTARQLGEIFNIFPNATLCFDIGHARQVDPTMVEASVILRTFHNQIRQLHVSEVNTQSKHDPLSLESILAFHRIAHLLPPEAPIILESRVAESQIEEEIQSAINALSSQQLLAVAGD
jgi:hypothetical protein